MDCFTCGAVPHLCVGRIAGDAFLAVRFVSRCFQQAIECLLESCDFFGVKASHWEDVVVGTARDGHGVGELWCFAGSARMSVRR